MVSLENNCNQNEYHTQWSYVVFHQTENVKEKEKVVSTDKTAREGDGKDMKQFHVCQSKLLKEKKRENDVIDYASLPE